MAVELDKIKTIVLLMFENRSFDHMLGHLSYEKIKLDIDGLQDPLNTYANLYKGDSYLPFNSPNDSQLPFDVPHEYNYVDIQLAKSTVTEKFTMKGFVEAYADYTKVDPNPQTVPMEFFSSGQVPITSFLAKNFCTCNHWFSSLPTSTQPNRTMAFTGDTGIFETKAQLIDVNDSIFDWMTRASVNWKVYHDGFSFFSLYPKLWKHVLSNKFNKYENLFSDLQVAPAETDPQVIIVEPSYLDAPHIGPDHPNDNHAPLAIGWGEDFLRQTYHAVTANPERWASTVFVVYYDEHGGFYDHALPPTIPYSIRGDSPHTFNSLGPRIPGIIISPFVSPGSVCNAILDHTSVLQFLAEKFTKGQPYSKTVDERSKHNPGIASLSVTLTNETTLSAPLAPSQPITVSSALGDTIATPPSHPMGQSFEMAAQQMISKKPIAVKKKYPELLQWKDAVEKARK